MQAAISFIILAAVLPHVSAFQFQVPTTTAFYKHYIRSTLWRRTVKQKQCVLVNNAPVLHIQGPSGIPEDQSPLLPGPSRGSPDTIRAQSACGDIGATERISPLAGPNGAISWMTCGINSTGWTPSYATVSDVITADLPSALRQGNSPFEACNAYLGSIEKYAAQFQVPSILVASFAMQESGCQPDEVGQGGEQGMMQISEDKCEDAPGGNCRDPDFNIRQGTQFLAETLKRNKGNLITTIGQYNGWYEGMTYSEATIRSGSSCCRCQQNLDYLFQILNGWLLNRNPIAPPRLGVYFNLDVCNQD